MLILGTTLLVASSVVSLAVTFLVLRNAEYLQVMAEPNARSSHTRATPSGGGLGIVAGGAVAALSTALSAPWPTMLVLACALTVAAIGFLDDRRPLSPAFRLVAQLGLATIMVGLCIPAGQLMSGLGLPLPWVVLVLVAIVATVYWINIFNFMDGIDGLAAAQAASMLYSAALLAALAAPGVLALPFFWWMMATAGAVAVFLTFNWSPATIFMGDAGSTYLGFMIAFFALATVALGWLSLWQWMILGGLFLTDATVTLVRRWRRGEKLTEAHRSHAYQRLARHWQSHRRAAGLYAAINLVWLLPCAYFAGDRLGGAVVAIVALAPLVVLVLRLGAGLPGEIRSTAT